MLRARANASSTTSSRASASRATRRACARARWVSARTQASLDVRGARAIDASARARARTNGTSTTMCNRARVATVVRAIEEPETFTDDDLDNIVFADLSEEAAISNKSGAGETMAAPDWMTQLNRLWGGASEIPVADAKLEDITGLLGGGLFQPLFKWMLEAGPVYLLPTGPVTSYVVVSDAACIKQVLFNYGSKYIKGTIAEAGEFLFGLGVALQELEPWKVRRKAVAPSLHRKYVEAMVDRCFALCADRMTTILEEEAANGAVGSVNLESRFSKTALDIIGISVFNYDFKALTTAAPVIQATYTALKEVETRSMDLLPTWRLPEQFLRIVSPRQRNAQDAVTVIRDVTQRLVDDCKRMVEEEEKVGGAEEWARDYLNESNPSVLRYLIAAREEVSSTQLRDDLLSLLVAGHETTASVLTWGTYELLKPENAEQLRLLRAELDEVLGTRPYPTFADLAKMPYLERCFHESMRLYPQPPVYTRRAVVEDVLPNGMTVPKNQDLLVSIYNLHRSPANWGPTSQQFEPMRFGPLANGQPNELNTDYRYVPFSAGPRRCPGDKFAVYEGIVIWATMLRRLDLELKPGHDVIMTSGATIHTKSGLLATVKKREVREVPEAERMDWANLMPAKELGGDEWYAPWNQPAPAASGKCPMGH
ncbi:putative cytochrome P450 monooxygenase [Ostreococcus tauri]|uniref:Putative cytochrome P450 monooxygenase n=1 Tax=Ostreococcus tauri TaxID=70448 RepID=A0A1Y5IH47_OSTTA|nr:putative cytochrome P450 monooxygenase [Ostreococcus tauri]